jgi:large subunit ribosomal protein L10
MTREEKQQLVKQWSTEFKDVPYAVLVDYRGLTVAQVTELRSKIRQSGSSYRVLKNTLAKLAVPGTMLEGLQQYFDGPTALTFNREDPIGMAKVLVDFAKETDKLKIKVGMLDGQLLEPDQVKELSKMPSREELLSKLLFLLNAPVQRLASALNGITRNFAVVLKQVADQKES